MRAALSRLPAEMNGKKTMLVALGEGGPPERFGDVEVTFVPYEDDETRVARYYQVADIHVHAARADTFPNTVLDALTCGTPVVAMAIGGIPEQVVDGRTGFLTPAGDARSMAKRVGEPLASDGMRDRFSLAAAEDARKRFDLNRRVGYCLDWYGEVESDFGARYRYRTI